MLLSFKCSISFTSVSFDSNFSYVKAQISVLVPLPTVSAFPICCRFEMKNKWSNIVIHEHSCVTESMFYKDKLVFI